MMLIVAALVTAGGCENRVGQCNKLIEVINSEGNKLKVSNDPAGLKKMADELDAAAKKLEGVEITIERLKSYRDEYKTFMLDFAKAARAFSELQSGDTKDAQKSQDALANLNSSLQKNSKLTEDINSYCQGKSQ